MDLYHFGLSMGTTSTCSVDPIKEITGICKEHGLFVNVDVAYLGAA
jgi:aromatic-L-amino-acid decarboxylase